MWEQLLVCLLLLPSLISTSSKGTIFPEFTFDPEPSDVTVRGKPSLLHCGAKGSPPPSISWRRDGVALGSAVLSNGSLMLEGGKGEEGRYQCVVTMPGIGTILSRIARVSFQGDPEFLESPSSQTVFLGQTAFFRCRVSPPSQVSWLKNGRPLQLNTSRLTVLPTGSLEITSVNIGDRAAYSCSIITTANGNKETRLTSQPAELRLNMDLAASHAPAPPTFLAVPSGVTAGGAIKALAGSTVTLECAANGVPSPRLTWLKDGVALELDDPSDDDEAGDGWRPGPRYSRSGHGSLTISSLEPGDRGAYQCRAENAEDTEDAAVEVAVRVPPAFLRWPASHAAGEKEDILLECEATGVPQPEVTWYKNGDLIIQSEYFQMVRGTDLKILGLVGSDAGVYQCLANSPAGSIQAAAHLKVKSKAGGSGSGGGVSTTMRPSLPSFLGGVGGGSTAVAGVPGAPTNLQAVITSTRFVTLSWEQPNSPASPITGYSVFYQQEGSVRERVVNSTRGSLEEISLQGLLPATTYTVRILAHNEHGPGPPSSPPLRLTTQAEVEVPGPPTHLAATPVSAFSLLVSWQPPHQPGKSIDKYKVYYRRGELATEEEVETKETQHHLTDLREFEEYTIWVSAFNSNGEGAYSEEVSCRTYSDIPADPPQNTTLEPASSTSIIVRWEPPPKESQNGIITGYKIKWRRAGKGNTQTVSTDGSRRLYAITGLKNGREYQVKLSALTVNGSGPATGWLSTSTFQSDLDESTVPDPPASLRAKATSDEITIMWSPPTSNSILVRGYTIGWGKGIPDEYTKVVDNKQRYFVIDNLKPNSEYVISLRAYNNIGDGRPIYETTRTRDEEAEAEPATPLVPPLGLHAIVLSATTVVLTWIDSTLPRNQLVTDNRYYIVRYTSIISMNADRPKHNYRNATDLNAMLDDLRPDTEYEFTVKVVKGRRQSPWSLVVLNSTQEAAPDSPPRDLNIIPADGNDGGDSAGSVTLTWLPPRRPNGRINGYVIFYTVDKRKQDREWVVEGVVGDKTAADIRGLEPDTRYYFKIQARNSKGYGPHSPVVMYRTKSATGGGGGMMFADSGVELVGSGNNAVAAAGIPPSVQYAVFASGGAIVLLAVIFGLVMCRRGNRALSAAAAAINNDEDRTKPYLKSEKNASLLRDKLINPPPPDLWINHDQLELRSLDSNQGEGGGEGLRAPSLPRSTPVDHRGSTSTLDRSRYITPYSGTESERSFSGRDSHRRLLRQSIAGSSANGGGGYTPVKPMKIAAINGKPKVSRYLSKESVASSSLINGGCGGGNTTGSCSSSTYIRSQYNLNPPPPPSTTNSSITCHSPDPLPGYHPCCGSDAGGPPSTIGDFNWGGGGNSSLEGGCNGGGSLVCGGGCHVVSGGGGNLTLQSHYISSAMSTSSADSGSAASASGGSRGACSGSGGSAVGSGGCVGNAARRPSQLRSFSAINMPPPGISQPKAVFVRPTPTSPFKRALSSHQQQSPQDGPASDAAMTSPTSSSRSGHLPAMAEVRSPDVLHPQDGPCDCLSQPIQASYSTEELNNEMRNLESVMKDLNAITGHPHIHCNGGC